MIAVRQRFSDFIESLQEPRRKFGAVCFLLAFLLFDFLMGGIYFLSGYYSLKTVGPAAEMAADISQLYEISVYVDTSEYLYWSIPFFVLAVVTAIFMIRYIVRQKRAFAKKKRPVRAKERFSGMREEEIVAVRVHTVNPEKAPAEDLRHTPPAWLLDPLAVVSDTKQKQAPSADTQQTAAYADTQRHAQAAYGYGSTQQPQQTARTEQPAFSYADFIADTRVSAPRNRVRSQNKPKADIPYAGSLQYVERRDKKKERSPYEGY